MDEQRGGNNEYKYLTTTHYINIEKGGKIDPFQKGNIYTELNTVISELEKGSNPTDLKLNLMILIHLVGDIHQPLHDVENPSIQYPRYHLWLTSYKKILVHIC